MNDFKIKGVIAIFVDENGNHLSNGACFDLNTCAGYDLKDAQEYRAKERLKNHFASHFFYGEFKNKISSHTLDCVCRDLMTHGSVKYIYVGHDE